MAKQKERLIKARHFEHGGMQFFPESHWRLVDKRVWIEIPSEVKREPLPEVEADIKERAGISQDKQKRGRPPKSDTL